MADQPVHSSNNYRWLWIAIGILFIINLATFAYVMRRGLDCAPDPAVHPGVGRPDAASAFNFIVHETRMDENQVYQYELMRNQHHDEVMRLRKVMSELRNEIYLNLSQLSEAKRDSLLSAIARNQLSMDSITIQHFRIVRSILKADQQIIYDRVLPEAIRMMAPPLAPPPPRERLGGGIGSDREAAPPMNGEPPPPMDRDAAPDRPRN